MTCRTPAALIVGFLTRPMSSVFALTLSVRLEGAPVQRAVLVLNWTRATLAAAA